MGRFEDSITIGLKAGLVSTMLTDLSVFPSFLTDGFRNFRLLTPVSRGIGARGAIDIRLLSTYQHAEFEIVEAGAGKAVLQFQLEPTELTLTFVMVDRGERTEMRLSVEYARTELPAYRIRTRLRQRFQLSSDVNRLFTEMLTLIKQGMERAERVQKTRDSMRPRSVPATQAAGSSSTPVATDKPVKAHESMPRPMEAKAVPIMAQVAPGQPPIPPKMEKSAASPMAAPPIQSIQASPTAAETTMTSVASSVASSGAPQMADGFTAVFAASELPPGQMKKVTLVGTDILVANYEGRFFAVGDTCPHRGSSLSEGSLDGNILACAMHGWPFDITNGECLSIPGAKVPCFETRLVDGQVQLKSNKG